MAIDFDAILDTIRTAPKGKHVRPGIVEMGEFLHNEYESIADTKTKIEAVEDDLSYVHSHLTDLQTANVTANSYVGENGTLIAANLEAGSLKTNLEALMNSDLVPYFKANAAELITRNSAVSNHWHIPMPHTITGAAYYGWRIVFTTTGESIVFSAGGNTVSEPLAGTTSRPKVNVLTVTKGDSGSVGQVYLNQEKIMEIPASATEMTIITGTGGIVSLKDSTLGTFTAGALMY